MKTVLTIFCLNLFTIGLGYGKVLIAESGYIDGSFFEYVKLELRGEHQTLFIEAKEAKLYLDHCLITSEFENATETETVHFFEDLAENQEINIELREGQNYKKMDCAIQSADDQNRGRVSLYSDGVEKPPGPGPSTE